VRLDTGIAWKRVAQIVRAAFENSAPARVTQLLTKTPDVPAPKSRTSVADIDPKNTRLGNRVLAAMRWVCLVLPGASETAQFGQPVWKVGKKVFAQAYCYESRWRVAFWVGVAAQSLMTADPRFEIPPYMGHNGWIALDVTKRLSEKELRALALGSYRHFALKRMLAQL
jgi:predicted DNA-binding protein (MmcQ/YjbR family)